MKSKHVNQSPTLAKKAIFICALLLVSIAGRANALPGDLNNDQLVNSLDLRILQMRRLGLPIATAENPDLDGNGTIDANDFSALARGIIGQPVVFRVGEDNVVNPDDVVVIRGLNFGEDILVNGIEVAEVEVDPASISLIRETNAFGQSIIVGVQFTAPAELSDGAVEFQTNGITIAQPVRSEVEIRVRGNDASEAATMRYFVDVSIEALEDIVVDVTTVAGTATENVDYIPVTQSITVPTLQITANSVVTLIDDEELEDAESLTIQISNPRRIINGVERAIAVSLSSQSSVTVNINDDEIGVEIEFNSDEINISEDSGLIFPGISANVLPAGTALPEDVTFSIVVEGDIDTESDFFVFNSELTIGAGASDTVWMPTVFITEDDNLVEFDESATLSFQLTAGIGRVGSNNPTTELTIADNDGGVTISFVESSSMVTEGMSGQVELVLNFEQSNKTLARDLSVDLEREATTEFFHSLGIAVPDEDYDEDDFSVTFPGGAGEGNTQSFTVSVIDDLLVEETESIVFELPDFEIDEISAGDMDSHELSIVENDTASVEFVSASSTLVEGENATIDVVLSLSPTNASLEGSASGGFSISYTDVETSRFQIRPSSFSTNSVNGDTSTIVTLLDNSTEEEDGSIQVNLSSLQTVQLGQITTHVATIIDDDSAQVTISNDR